MLGLLRLSALPATGSGIRIAVVDSGVHAAHPHVQGVAGGVGVTATGEYHADYVDRLGHGTAVMAVIREKAPDADVLAIKVFDGELKATSLALQAAIDRAIAERVHLVNLSLGTANPEHEPTLIRCVQRARAAGVLIVAAAPTPDARWLPGAIDGVVAVEVDWTLARDVCRVALDDVLPRRVWASGYPRPIPGVPPERNLRGISFAVANASGLLARALAVRETQLRDTIAGVLEGESGTVPSS